VWRAKKNIDVVGTELLRAPRERATHETPSQSPAHLPSGVFHGLALLRSVPTAPVAATRQAMP